MSRSLSVIVFVLVVVLAGLGLWWAVESIDRRLSAEASLPLFDRVLVVVLVLVVGAWAASPLVAEWLGGR